jgi:hypothetical protein
LNYVPSPCMSIFQGLFFLVVMINQDCQLDWIEKHLGD